MLLKQDRYFGRVKALRKLEATLTLMDLRSTLKDFGMTFFHY